MSFYQQLIERHAADQPKGQRWNDDLVKYPEPKATRQDFSNRGNRTKLVQRLRQQRVRRRCVDCGTACSGERCSVHHRKHRVGGFVAALLLVALLAGCTSIAPTTNSPKIDSKLIVHPIPLPEVSVAAMAERAIVSRAVAAAVAPPITSGGTNVAIAIDPPTDHSWVSAYYIHQGGATGGYTNSYRVTERTNTIALAAPGTYRFAATALLGSEDPANFAEGEMSEPLTYTATAVAPPQYARLTHQHRIDQWLWPGPAGTLERSTNLTTVYVTITNTSGVVTNRPVMVQTNWQPLKAIASGESFLTTNLLAQEFYRVKH